MLLDRRDERAVNWLCRCSKVHVLHDTKPWWLLHYCIILSIYLDGLYVYFEYGIHCNI